MFSGVNDESDEREIVEPVVLRVLRHAGVIVVSVVGVSLLYAVAIFLTIFGYVPRKASEWKSRRFSTT